MHAHAPVTVAIARFPDLLGLGLRAALESDPSMSVVARDIPPARIGTMLRAHRPKVLILDVATLRDYAQVREITLEYPDTYLVLLVHGLSSVESAQLLAFGASVCMTPDIQLRDLRHAVHLASRGVQLQLLPAGSETEVSEPLLTPREGEVLALLRQNKSNAQTALALSIGVETVRSHARQIYRKLGVASRRGLLALDGAPPAAPPPVAAPAPAAAPSPTAAPLPAAAPRSDYPVRLRAAAPAVRRRAQHR